MTAEPPIQVDTAFSTSAFADPARRLVAWRLHNQAWDLVAQGRVAEALGLATKFARHRPGNRASVFIVRPRK